MDRFSYVFTNELRYGIILKPICNTMAETIFLIIVLVFSVVIHEVSHGYAASALGDDTARRAGRLTLNPLSHIDPVGSVLVPLILAMMPGGLMLGWAKPVPYNPYNLRAKRFGPAIVALAGPLSNVALAFLMAVAVRILPTLGFALSTAFLQGAASIVVINIVLACFNMMPVPPLDGSKVLFSLLSYRYHFIEEALEHYWFIFLLAALLLWPYLANIVLSLATLLLGV